MNLRLGTLFSFLLLVLAAYGLYLVKWEVHDLKRRNMQLEANILQEKEAITVLEAEWTYLNRPERLSALAEKYLDLAPENGQQMVDIAKLTRPPSVAEPDGLVVGAQLASYKNQGF